jgi:hypothetical protein
MKMKRKGSEYDHHLADEEQARKMKAKEANKKSGLFGKSEVAMTKAEAKKAGLTGGRNKNTRRVTKKVLSGKKYGYNMGGKVMEYNMGGGVPTYAGMPMMAEGGVVPKKKKKKVSKKKSIDGIARQGKTRGRMV